MLFFFMHWLIFKFKLWNIHLWKGTISFFSFFKRDTHLVKEWLKSIAYLVTLSSFNIFTNSEIDNEIGLLYKTEVDFW